MHPNEELLYEYAEQGPAGPPEVGAHLSGCSACEREVAELRSFLSDMRSELVWGEGETFAEMPASLSSLSRRITSERAEGEGVGAIEALNARVLEELERDPHQALAFSAEAIARASSLSDDYPPAVRAQLLGMAWKNRANALRHIGEYHEAFAALDEASRAFETSRANAFDLATVDYVRATIHYFMAHYREAQELVDRAAVVFAEFADHRRVTHARLLAGSIAFEIGDATKARDVFYELLPDAHADGDRATLARLFSNIAQCYVNIGDHQLASTYCHQGLSLYRQLGMRTEAARATWILGRLLSAGDKIPEARERLDEAEAEFLRLGMPVEASLVSLDVAELMLAAGELDGVPALCTRIVERFVSADLPEKTQLAHTLATEALRQGGTPTELVTATRQLIHTLPATLSATTIN